VRRKGLDEDRVRNGAKKLMKARQGSTQGRLDSFFKVMPAAATPNGKRKSEEIKNGSANGAKKGFFKR
jgi:flap endonuclease-1